MQSRIIITIIIVAIGLSIDAAVGQPTNVADTNGFTCVLWLANNRPFYEGQKLPACRVCFNNETTNWVSGYLDLPPQAVYDIGLFDSDGKPVEKTATGKEYGTWTPKQIEDWFNNAGRENRRTSFFSVPPTGDNPIGIQKGSFGLPEVFQLKHAGEYTLHVHARMARHRRDETGKGYLAITWLPEAIAKIQIRPVDIPSTNLPTNGQTNFPAK